jgi:6-pyruvoyltetrahydropterin/6-carboxytetrahydropterin synthase
MELYKEFTFDSAHFLPNVPEGHQCARMHGHTYYVKIILDGPLDSHLGWVVDFADVKKAWEPLKKILDHHLLNEIPGLENPTAEHIAVWIWDKLKPSLPLLSAIELKETPTTGIIYRGK